mgnify:FL=1
MSKPTYLQESVDRLCDADRRASDHFLQWRGEALTPEEIILFQRIEATSQALEQGLARLNETYASFTGDAT